MSSAEEDEEELDEVDDADNFDDYDNTNIDYGFAPFEELKSEKYLPPQKAFNLADWKFKHEINVTKKFPSLPLEKLVSDASENQIKGIEQFDKIFASAWIDNENVAVGTKCNQFCVWNRNTLQWRIIPLPVIDYSPSLPPVQDSCGIHSIALSPLRQLLAIGGHDPSEVVLFDTETFKPKHVFTGHRDWVFGIQFIDDQTLVTCGRDGWINLYSMRVGENSFVKKQLITRPAYSDVTKVRDIKFHRPTEHLASVSPDGNVKFWDIGSLDEIASITLADETDAVSMAFHESGNLLAVGSGQYLSLIDPRCQQPVCMIHLSDPPLTGVRSVNFQEHILSAGTIGGALSFFDVRAKRALFIPKTQKIYHQASSGWLSRDGNFQAIYGFANPDYTAAIYTHQYDPTGTQLFAAGGPLYLGLKGSYAALWS